MPRFSTNDRRKRGPRTLTPCYRILLFFFLSILFEKLRRRSDIANSIEQLSDSSHIFQKTVVSDWLR